MPSATRPMGLLKSVIKILIVNFITEFRIWGSTGDGLVCNFFQIPAYVLLEIIERSANMNTEYKQLTRSTSNRMIAGVCAGLADYLGIDPTIVRLLTLLAFFTGFGGIALVYLIMALVIPEQTTAQSQ
jgi:phage shock protein PspC (stress-responsive transcriptional regulator)